jgi:hypothetical protein
MKKTKLIDYYEAKLKSEPQHEKYTPTNFAAFLLEIRDFVMEMPEMMQDDSDMNDLLKEGKEDVYSGKKVEGAKKVRKAAEGGSPMAICLLGLHLTANVKSKQDLHLGVGCLYWAQSVFEEVTECLNLCYDYRDIPATEPDDKEDERYASCHLCRHEDEDGIGRYEWAPFISMICHHEYGYCLIGSIRINVGWYKEQIEVIEKEGKVDVYAAPYLPVWYVWKTIGETIGVEKMNEKAGVNLYDEDEEPGPNHLRLWNIMDEIADLTHLFYDGAYMELATGYLFFRTQSVQNLSYELYEEEEEKKDNGEEDEAPVWIVNIPEDWDIYSMKVQHDIARYVNNILFPIAQETLPNFINKVLKETGLICKSCRVVANDDVLLSQYAPDGKTIAVRIPFWFIKYPAKFIEEYFLTLDDDEKHRSMSMRHCYGQLNDLNTTTMNDRYLESWGKLRKVAYPFLYDDDDD